MGRLTKHLTLMALVALGAIVTRASAADLTDGMASGKAELKSMGPLSFGPDGVLFVADTKAATIYAIATGDTKPGAAASLLKIDGINQKIAAVLGTAADQVLINDMAINPISRTAYLAVSRGRGPDAIAVLLRVSADGKIEPVSLDNVKFSKAALSDAPADAAPAAAPGGRAPANPRLESITDIAYVQDRVVIAGLSNEEFSSSLRSIPFPFKGEVSKGAGIEMYHGSHGRFETRSPVRTFVSYTVGQEAELLAAYTCTPLVELAMSDLKPGAKVKGKTVAEFGAGNRPLDMIVYQKGGKDFLLLSNSNHGVMKIGTEQLASVESIVAPVPGTKGLPFEKVQDWTGVVQLDKLDQQYAVVLRTGAGGAVNLESLALP